MLLSSEALLAALKSAMSSSTLSLGGNTSATANVSGDLNQGTLAIISLIGFDYPRCKENKRRRWHGHGP